MSNKIALKLWLQLAKTSAMIHAQVNARFRADYGQSMARFDVLSQLARIESKALGVGALSASLIASSGNITRLLDRMQNEGLLDRRTSQHDRRGVTIFLTPKGAELFAQMAKDHEHWVRDMLVELPGCDQSDLLENLLGLQRVLALNSET